MERYPSRARSCRRRTSPTRSMTRSSAGEIFPVACGVATKNLGTTALLDLLVEGVPSPDEHEGGIAVNGDGASAFVFKTLADPFAGRINVFRVLNGTIKSDSTVVNARAHAKERIGHLLALQGKEHTQVDELGPGRHRRDREAQGDGHRRPPARRRASSSTRRRSTFRSR